MDAGDLCRVISGRPVLRAANPGVGSPRRSPSERKEARHANAGQDDVRVLRAEMRQTQRPARKSLGFKKPIEKDRISSVALTARIRRSAFEPSSSPAAGGPASGVCDLSRKNEQSIVLERPRMLSIRLSARAGLGRTCHGVKSQ